MFVEPAEKFDDKDTLGEIKSIDKAREAKMYKYRFRQWLYDLKLTCNHKDVTGCVLKYAFDKIKEEMI